MVPQPNPTVLTNPFAPDLLADEVVSFEIVNGTVRISLASLRVCNDVDPAGVQLVVVGRVVLGVASAQALAVNLYNYLGRQVPAPEGWTAAQAASGASPH